MSVPIPKSLNWFVWRIATHERNRASRAEIETEWPLVWLIDAHLALNVFDRLDREVADAQRRKDT